MRPGFVGFWRWKVGGRICGCGCVLGGVGFGGLDGSCDRRVMLVMYFKAIGLGGVQLLLLAPLELLPEAAEGPMVGG